MAHGVCALQISLIVSTQFYKMQGTLFASNQRLNLPFHLPLLKPILPGQYHPAHP